MVEGAVVAPVLHAPAAVSQILIAEDDGALRELLRVILGREGFSATLAADGEEAVKLLKDEPFELMLLDLMMPRKNGFEVLDLLAHQPDLRPRFVLLMTAATDQFLEPALHYDVQGVLRKPFDVRELTRMIRALVTGSAN